MEEKKTYARELDNSGNIEGSGAAQQYRTTQAIGQGRNFRSRSTSKGLEIFFVKLMFIREKVIGKAFLVMIQVGTYGVM
jgi:hypothetical protein